MEVNSNAEFLLLDLNSVSEQLGIPLICMVPNLHYTILSHFFN